jgi:hypothetical protein
MNLSAGLAGLHDVLEASLRPSLTGRATPAAAPLPPLSTKLGGRPDLPPGTPWPVNAEGEPLALSVQCNLTELAGRYPDQLPWPAGGGLIQLFIDYDGDATELFVHPDLAVLRPATPPDDEEAVLPECAVGWGAGRCRPDYASADDLWEAHTRLDKPLQEQLEDVLEDFAPGELQLGGYPAWMQDAAYWEASALDQGLITGPDAPGHWAALSAARDRISNPQAQADGWELVLQLTDGSGVDTDYTQCGTFYLMAPRGPEGRWQIDRLQVVFQCT